MHIYLYGKKKTSEGKLSTRSETKRNYTAGGGESPVQIRESKSHYVILARARAVNGNRQGHKVLARDLNTRYFMICMRASQLENKKKGGELEHDPKKKSKRVCGGGKEKEREVQT